MLISNLYLEKFYHDTFKLLRDMSDLHVKVDDMKYSSRNPILKVNIKESEFYKTFYVYVTLMDLLSPIIYVISTHVNLGPSSIVVNNPEEVKHYFESILNGQAVNGCTLYNYSTANIELIKQNNGCSYCKKNDPIHTIKVFKNNFLYLCKDCYHVFNLELRFMFNQDIYNLINTYKTFLEGIDKYQEDRHNAFLVNKEFWGISVPNKGV